MPIVMESDVSAPVFVENKFLRVGVALEWGGAITHISTPGGPNLINSHDLGRQIQQSYYSGPGNYQRAGKEKAKGWAQFPWNPIQSGDAFNNGSQVIAHRVRDGELYVKTVPMLWPMNNDPAECVMETWIALSPASPQFEYRARLTNARTDHQQYPARMQELPAVYVNGPWHRLVTYTGDKPFTAAMTTEIRNNHKEPWPWVNFIATEGWAALVNDAGTGLGICVPAATEFHGGFHGQRGAGDAESDNTGYMAPVRHEILDHNIVYEYAGTFVLGSVAEIRATARRLAAPKLPVWEFARTRQGWTYQNGRDAGWPLTGCGLTVCAVEATQPVRLIGPMAFWRSAAAPCVAVRLSTVTAGTLTVFWRGTPPPQASVAPIHWNVWIGKSWVPERAMAAAIPTGASQWVTVTLAESPAYTGGITGLALELPDGVMVHEVRLLAPGATPP